MSASALVRFISLSRRHIALVNSLHQRRNFHGTSTALKETNFSIHNEGKTLTLNLTDQPSTFHSTWLKNHCHCPQCKDPQSGRPVFKPPISDTFTLSDVRIEGDHLFVRFREDTDPDHQGVFPISWMKDNRYGESVLKQQAREARPKPLKGAPAEFSYNDIQSSDDARFDLYCRIIEDGMSIVRGSPAEHGVSEKFMNTYISQCIPNSYGPVFLIINSESGIDAYKPNEYVPYHQDVPYYEGFPGTEIFHFLKRSSCIEGGESLMIDGAYLAECFRQEHPEDFDVFTRVRVTFGLQADGLNENFFENRRHFYNFQSPHIVLGFDNEIVRLAWSPANELALNIPSEMVEPYYRARYKFLRLLENFHLKHTLLLHSGDMLLFNNRRMFHSRRKIKLNGGERVIEGVCCSNEELKSEALSLAQKLNKRCPNIRLFNGNYVQ